MRLFGKKKSNTAIREEPPAISRPRAQGHLPPTSAPKPSNSSRRSYGSTHTSEQTTPLYARFARADSFENLSLRAKTGADSRAPSMAPTNQELEDDASRLGYDRPWARELIASLDSPEPVQPANTGSSVRMVSNPSVRDRKTSVDKRLSLEAVAAADPFMASKMQSVMRRAPSNVKAPDMTPQRSVTAPPSTNKPSHPPPRIPTAPPTRSISTKSGPKSPPSSRPSFDDDDTSVFSHSNAGHAQPRSTYPSIPAGAAAAAAASAKRERGPPPVAGTPSAYAWRSGQSDDGHGGNSSFYTGGSQVNPYTWSQPGSSLPQPSSLPAQPLSMPSQSFLPPGAAPPNPLGQPNPNHAPPSSMSMGNVLKKRTPSNPPVNRTPAPAGHHGARRMSVDGKDARPLSGGPGTWGGSAIAVPHTAERERERERGRATQGAPGSSVGGPSSSTVGPSSTVQGPNSTVPGSNSTIPGSRSTVAPPSSTAGPDSIYAPSQVYGDLSRTPTVKSVQPGEIFRHPGSTPMPLSSTHSAPYQAVSPPPVPAKSPVQGVSSSHAQAPVQGASLYPAQGMSSPPPQATSSAQAVSSATSPPRLVTSPRQVGSISSQSTTQTSTLPPPPLPAKKSTGNAPQTATPSLPQAVAPSSLHAAPLSSQTAPPSPSPTTPYKHSPSSHGPSYSAYGPTPGSAYGNVGANGGYDPSTSAIRRVSQSPEVRGADSRAQSLDVRASQVSDVRKSQVSDVRKSQVSDVRTVQGDRRASQLPDPRPSYSSEARASQYAEGRASPTKPAIANRLTASPVGGSESAWSRSGVAEPGSGRATPVSPNGAGLAVPRTDARSSVYSGASSVSVVPPSTPLPPASPSKSVPPNRELPQPPASRPGPSPHPPSSLREAVPPRAPSSMSVSSYGTALPLESDPGFDSAPTTTKLAIGSLAPINTSGPRSGSPTPTTSSAAPTSAMVTARMTPTTTAALSPMTIPSLPPSTPQKGLVPPRAVSPTPSNRRAVSPTPTNRRAVSPTPTTRSESDESMHAKKRNLLVKTRKIDAREPWSWARTERGERSVCKGPADDCQDHQTNCECIAV
ncbi:hypothetical protein BN14_06126 [Rhizoctonia solani AG-1 IB]|uniref:Uncharacterized protein n=1 Tax=Thanatephorus cucumeris (strain AG1-IB / isolate 7/3/14) TaxID=1108050 RepID=M5BWR2_THACB|nr:hypothetical protein BN14_06126 [Rhizoctonia solani AG-1 IB]